MKIKLLSNAASIPQKSSTGAAGYDLFASKAVVVPGSKSINKKISIGHATVPTGLALAIPDGYVGRIGSRSGLSVKYNIEVGAGWIDSDYRGEVLVELKNLDSSPFTVKKGDRIAQLVLLRVGKVRIKPVKQLPPTQRGPRGFGSTGLR